MNTGSRGKAILGCIGIAAVILLAGCVPPECGFTFAPQNPLVGETVQFTDQSSDPDQGGRIVAWLWDFGDGNTSTQQNPTHSYADAGTYTVTQTVTDNDGLTSTCSQQVTVLAPPSCSFSYAPASPVVGPAVQFSDASTDQDGSIVAWAWEFGDGATSNEQNPAHAYASWGTYTVALTVTDNDGLTSTCSQQVTVLAGPSCSFSYSPASPVVEQAVQFTDASSDPDGVIVSWQWDFGDGNSSTEQNPTHAYAARGTYTVSLTVTDDDGLVSSCTQEVQVSGFEVSADFYWYPLSPGEGEPVGFQDLSTGCTGLGAIAAWRWDFGDGYASSERSPAHAFADNGVYTVSLTVTDICGRSAAVSKVIEVANRAPICDAGPDRQTVVGSQLAFQAEASDPGVRDTLTFQWDFGDGHTASGPSAGHAYSAGGVYQVMLRVTDKDGAEAASTALVHVWEGVVPGGVAYDTAVRNIHLSYFGQRASGPDGRLLLSARLSSPEADERAIDDWPQWVEFTVVDMGGSVRHRVYADVRPESIGEATASSAVTLGPGAYVVWADVVSPGKQFRVLPHNLPAAIAVGQTANAAWGASADPSGEGVCFALSAWRLDSATPNAQFICLASEGDGLHRVLWASAADAVALQGGVVTLRGTCSADGIYRVRFQATLDTVQGTFSVALDDLWSATGVLDSIVSRPP